MANILDGRKMADQIKLDIKNQIANQNLSLGLAVILVGSDPASHLYVSLKEKACIEAGINFEKFIYADNESDKNIISKIEKLNQNPEINGILVQLPLPNHDTDKIIAAINPLKDVDGFHKTNLKNLETDKPAIASAVALGIVKLIESTNTNLSNKTATVVSSELFAKPIVALLSKQNVKVNVIDPNDSNLSSNTKNSDILIVAAGKPGIIKGETIKPNSIVIDVGTTKINGKLLGDVHESAKEIAEYITPVPGGVGPMTVAMLLSNIIKASNFQR